MIIEAAWLWSGVATLLNIILAYSGVTTTAFSFWWTLLRYENLLRALFNFITWYWSPATKPRTKTDDKTEKNLENLGLNCLTFFDDLTSSFGDWRRVFFASTLLDFATDSWVLATLFWWCYLLCFCGFSSYFHGLAKNELKKLSSSSSKFLLLISPCFLLCFLIGF